MLHYISTRIKIISTHSDIFSSEHLAVEHIVHTQTIIICNLNSNIKTCKILNQKNQCLSVSDLHTRSKNGHTPRPFFCLQYSENSWCRSTISCLLRLLVASSDCLHISYRCAVSLSSRHIGTGTLSAKSPKYSSR